MALAALAGRYSGMQLPNIYIDKPSKIVEDSTRTLGSKSKAGRIEKRTEITGGFSLIGLQSK
jgi:hypothetical protein